MRALALLVAALEACAAVGLAAASQDAHAAEPVHIVGGAGAGEGADGAWEGHVGEVGDP